MICPSCGQENPEGRRFCRHCAKPLVPGVAPRAAEVSVPAQTPTAPAAIATASPKVNKLAIASLACGFLGLLVPFGVAAVAFGHVSRSQIAKSGGREKGTGIAFAGLILGYGQLAIFALILVAALSVFRQLRAEFDKENPNTRAALIERLVHGDPYKVTPERSARQEQTAIQALHLIRAKEAQYVTEHPDEGYACEMYKLGFDPGADTELGTLFRESHYDTKFIRCGSIPGTIPGSELSPMYVIVSIPRSEGNGPEAPVFCLDQVNGIERYSSGQSGDAIAAIMTSRTDPCPLTGTHVD